MSTEAQGQNKRIKNSISKQGTYIRSHEGHSAGRKFVKKIRIGCVTRAHHDIAENYDQQEGSALLEPCNASQDCWKSGKAR